MGEIVCQRLLRRDATCSDFPQPSQVSRVLSSGDCDGFSPAINH